MSITLPDMLPPHVWARLAANAQAKADRLREKVAEMRDSKKADRLEKQIVDMEYAILLSEKDARNMKRWSVGDFDHNEAVLPKTASPFAPGSPNSGRGDT